MSAQLGEASHTKLRALIVKRNAAFRKEVPTIVKRFIGELALSKQTQTLSQCMDKLSRHVLFATFFGEQGAKAFERIYEKEVTEKLLDALFALDSISSVERTRLQALRHEIFSLGLKLISINPKAIKIAVPKSG